MGRNLLSRILRYPSAAVLALAVMVVGHNLTFLLAYGSDYAAKLASTGDGKSWDDTVAYILVAAVLLAILATLRLAYLLRWVRTTYPDNRVDWSRVAYLRMLLPVWMKLLAAAVALFVFQENYERWAIGLPVPGLSVLGAVGLVSPIVVFALVSLAFAVVISLYRLGLTCLEAIVAEAQNRSWRRAPSRPRRVSDPEAVPTSVIARNLAGRAPPAFLPA